MSDWKNMLVYGKGGPSPGSKGNMQELRTNVPDGALLVKQGGKYADAALAGRVFSIANQAACATTAALATTWTGLAVGNPVGSGVNVVLLQFGFGFSVVGPEEGVIGLMTGSSLVTAIAASLTPRPALVNGPASKVYATAGQTIATPVLERIVGQYGTGAITTYSTLNNAVDLDGSLVLQPGSFVATYSTTIITTAILFSFVWEEVPI